MTTLRASSLYPDQPITLDITDYLERPANDKRSLQHKQKYITHTVTQGYCPTPQTSPTYIAMNAAAAAPAKPH